MDIGQVIVYKLLDTNIRVSMEDPFAYRSHRSGAGSSYVMTLNLDVSVIHILEYCCDFVVEINHN